MTVAPGRPRSDHARDAILVAAWELFAEIGLRELTIEAIARRAGVGKTTIYRWWPSKAAVVLDALHVHFDTTIGFPDTGSVADDLRRQLRAVIRLLRTEPGQAYLTLVAESRHDPDLARELADRYLATRRAGAVEVVRRGIDRGELRPDTDPELIVDLVYGPLYYRLLVSHDPPKLTYADHVVTTVLHGIAAAAPRRVTRRR